MGYPMAQHPAQAGHAIALWSNTAAKATRLLPAFVLRVLLGTHVRIAGAQRGTTRYSQFHLSGVL